MSAPARPASTIRVFLVDDQTLVRQGIRSLLALADGIEVVAEAADGKQAMAQIPQAAPDVVLMDMRMPVMSGLEALQAMAQIPQAAPARCRRRSSSPPSTTMRWCWPGSRRVRAATC